MQNKNNEILPRPNLRVAILKMFEKIKARLTKKE